MFKRLAVMGTGAIGCTFGAYLSRAGHDVTLIDTWPEHVETMREKGLTITAPDEEFTTPVNAIHLGEVNKIQEPFDAVFLAVKSYDTVWATHFIMRYLKPEGIIVSTQNGINDEVIAPIVGFSREIPCVITFGAGLYEPGHGIRTGDPYKLSLSVGELTGVSSQRVKDLAELLGAIGQTKVTNNVWGERWAKLATNCMANPVCAFTGLGSADVRTNADVSDLPIRIAAEVVKVGQALGIEVEAISNIPAEDFAHSDDPTVFEDVKTRLAEGAHLLGTGRPSMLQDVMKGRKTEIDYLNGYVVGRGAEVGVSTPFNAAIRGAVRSVERGEVTPDVGNINLLEV